MTWYQKSLSVILGVVRENPEMEKAELRKKVADAYPFGPRENFPYKAWLKAVNAVLGPSEVKQNRAKGKDASSISQSEQMSLMEEAE